VRRCIAVVAALAAAACGSANDGGSRTAPSTSPRTPHARLVEQFQHKPSSTVLNLRLWHGYAGWTAPAQSTSGGDQVAVLDLATRTEKVLTTLAPSHLLFDVEGDEHTVVYVEEDRRATDKDPMVNWTMKAIDLGTGSVTTIASSTGPSHYSLAPTPAIRLPWIAWSEPMPVPQGQRVDFLVISYNFQTKERHVLTDAGGTNSTLALLGSTVVYDHNQPSDRHSYDVYARPANASAPAVMLSNSGSATQPFASQGWIGWEGMSGGYTSVWLMSYDASTGRHGPPVAVDLQSEGNARLGAGFVMWLGFGGPIELRPAAATSTADVVTVEPRATLSLGGGWGAWNTMIAWVAGGSGAPVIKVATVSVQ
jgi:hypothetical protein